MPTSATGTVRVDTAHGVFLRSFPTMQHTSLRTYLPAWVWFAGACVVCLAILIYRRPDAFTAPQFYAEDGRDFFAQAYSIGWESLFYRTMGYFALYPRLVDIIGLSVGVPVLYVPMLHSAGCLAMYLAIWWSVFRCFPVSLTGRLLAVLATVLVPVSNEIWMNTTNVQWPMALLLPVLCLGDPPRSLLGKLRTGMLLSLAAFTGPFALLMAPVVLFHLVRSGVRKLGAVPWMVWIVLVGALVNAWSLIEHGSVERSSGAFEPDDPGFIRAVCYQLWFPVFSNEVIHLPRWAMIALIVLMPIGWLRIMYKAPGSKRAFIEACGAAFLVLLGSTLISYRGDPGFLSPFSGGGRYFYLPAVLLTWSLLASVHFYSAARSLLALTVGGWWAFQTIHVVGPWIHRDHGWPHYAKALENGAPMIVPITPEGWLMYVSKEHPTSWPAPFTPGWSSGK